VDVCYDVPTDYLTRHQLVSQQIATKAALGTMVAPLPDHQSEPVWGRDNKPSVGRFRGHDLALLIAYDSTVRAMEVAGYSLPNYTAHLVAAQYMFPEVIPPDRSRAARDLTNIARQWSSGELQGFISWNKGRKPLFTENGKPVSSTKLTAKHIHMAEVAIVPELHTSYQEGLYRMMQEQDVQFAQLNQEKKIRLAIDVQGVAANTELSAWVDPRPGRSTPALAEHPDTGRSLVVYPTEYREVR
jgi:hypothetical protein